MSFNKFFIILKCVFQLNWKKQKQHYYCTQLWQVFATCVRACEVKETETETGLPYCFRRDKKNSLNDNDHFGFEEVRFKRNLRKRKQQIPFFSLEPTIYGVS